MNPNDDIQDVIGLEENVRNEMGPEGGMPQPNAESINSTAIIEQPSGGSSTVQAKEPSVAIDSHQDEKDASEMDKVRDELSEIDGSNTKPGESIDARKDRIESLWSEWTEIQGIPELVSLFDRKAAYSSDKDPKTLLQEQGYPQRTKIPDLDFEWWTVNIDTKFVKDGYVYLLRGDHPGLERKGFYSRTYGYGKKTTEQLTHDLHSSNEVGYLLYNNDAYLKTATPGSSSIAQELALKQSEIGGSSFISTTTNLEAAIAGTGNQPDPEEQKNYEVYIVRIPIDSVINSNTGNHYGLEENEYLVPDYVVPDEIIAKFPRDQREGVYQFMHEQLGVSREDLGMADANKTVQI